MGRKRLSVKVKGIVHPHLERRCLQTGASCSSYVISSMPTVNSDNPLATGLLAQSADFLGLHLTFCVMGWPNLPLAWEII